MGNAIQTYSEEELERIKNKSPKLVTSAEELIESIEYYQNSTMKKGQKYSQGKAPMGIILKQFPLALEAVAERTEFGHKKYLEHDADYMNFKRVPNAKEQYFNAAVRHLAGIGEENELEHIKASAWCILAYLQLTLEDNE